MVSDAQVRLLRQKRMERKTQEAAAAAAGMSVRTARTWARGPLPSAGKTPQSWRTRPDPFAGVWEQEIVPLLTADDAGGRPVPPPPSPQGARIGGPRAPRPRAAPRPAVFADQTTDEPIGTPAIRRHDRCHQGFESNAQFDLITAGRRGCHEPLAQHDDTAVGGEPQASELLAEREGTVAAEGLDEEGLHGSTRCEWTVAAAPPSDPAGRRNFPM